MNKGYLVLAGRIREELGEIEKTVNRALRAWQGFKSKGDDAYLDSVALNLHGFYTALERIFEVIATEVDQSKPQGENWHQELLRQMATDVVRVRPSVISGKLRDSLDDYRGFRHVVRNVYTFRLSPSRMAPLVEALGQVFADVRKEMGEFLSFLEIRGGQQ